MEEARNSSGMHRQEAPLSITRMHHTSSSSHCRGSRGSKGSKGNCNLPQQRRHSSGTSLLGCSSRRRSRSSHDLRRLPPGSPCQLAQQALLRVELLPLQSSSRGALRC
jgi:hypothetical protein